MLQDLLTGCATSVLGFGFLLFVVSFVMYGWQKAGTKLERESVISTGSRDAEVEIQTIGTPAPGTLPLPEGHFGSVISTIEEAALVDSATVVIAQYWANGNKDCEEVELYGVDTQVQFAGSSTVELANKGIRELRHLCLQRGLKGAGRWSKPVCLKALSASLAFALSN